MTYLALIENGTVNALYIRRTRDDDERTADRTVTKNNIVVLYPEDEDHENGDDTPDAA